MKPDATDARPAKLAGTGTSVSVGVLTAYFAVPHLPGPLGGQDLAPEAVVHGLMMALVAGVVAAGARGAGDLIAPYLPGRK